VKIDNERVKACIDQRPWKTERGFGFLGYHFKPEENSPAWKPITDFIKKALRLYEQEPLHREMKRLGEYVHR